MTKNKLKNLIEPLPQMAQTLTVIRSTSKKRTFKVKVKFMNYLEAKNSN